MNRDEAWELLTTYTKSPNLQKHALAVEAAMRRYAREFGEDEETWGIVGLLHDFDYEAYPDEHPERGATLLEEMGYPEDVIHAIRAHADFTGVPRKSRLDKTLYAVDELTGFIVAVALIRPSKSLHDVDV
ncbi:MAG: HD domain-containing protein, partial [Candidatus Binatia bacterium]